MHRPALRRAALRRVLFLVDFVAGWSVLQESTNQQPNPQNARHDAAQHGAEQGRAAAFVESPLRAVRFVPCQKDVRHLQNLLTQDKTD